MKATLPAPVAPACAPAGDETLPERWTQLLVEAQAGNRDALDVLLREMLPWLVCVVRASLRNDADVWDVVQETLLRLYQSLGTFDPHRGGVRGWVRRIARNQITDLHRRVARHPLEPLGEMDPCDNRTEPASAQQEDTRAELRQALTTLNPADRAVLILRYDCDLGYKELGQVLGIPLSTAATRLQRSIRYLRGRLRKTE
jgi:RNA polymerase sigma-70 factor (ECF subfamily)